MKNNPTPVPDSLVDSHVHLDFPQFDADRKEMLQRARAAGVAAFVLPAVRAVDWPKVKSVAGASRDIYACYGLHPCFCADHQAQDLADLRLWVEREKPVAVGECGLDLFPEFANSESNQRLYFEEQLSIARDYQLPVVLHARRAVDVVLKGLRQAAVNRGVMHSFSGSLQQAKAAIDQGMMIGVGGAVTHERAQKLRKVVASLPLDVLLLETDAPDQPGALYRGQRNEPAFIGSVLDVIDSLRPESRQQIASACTENTRRLFSLKK